MNHAGVQHVEHEQCADDPGGQHDRDPVRDRGPVPLPERDIVGGGVLAGVEADDGPGDDQEQ